MTKKQIEEYAELLGISVEEAIQLRKRGEEARKKNNRFEAKAGEGRFEKPNAPKQRFAQ